MKKSIAPKRLNRSTLLFDDDVPVQGDPKQQGPEPRLPQKQAAMTEDNFYQNLELKRVKAPAKKKKNAVKVLEENISLEGNFERQQQAGPIPQRQASMTENFFAPQRIKNISTYEPQHNIQKEKNAPVPPKRIQRRPSLSSMLSFESVYDPNESVNFLIDEVQDQNNVENFDISKANVMQDRIRTKGNIHGVSSSVLLKGKKSLKKQSFEKPATVRKIEQSALFDKDKSSDHFPLVSGMEYLHQLPRNPDTLLHLDLSGIEQLTDMFFYMYKFRRIDLLNLQTLNITGCSNITDIGMAWCAQSMPDLKKIIMNGCKNLTEKTLSYFLNGKQQIEKIEMTGTSVAALPDTKMNMALYDFYGCPLMSPPTSYYLENSTSALPANKFTQLKQVKLVILKDSNETKSVGSILTKSPENNETTRVWASWTPNSKSQSVFNIFEITRGYGIENMVLGNGGIVLLPCQQENTEEQVEKLARDILSILSKCQETVFILGVLMSETSTVTSEAIAAPSKRNKIISSLTSVSDVRTQNDAGSQIRTSVLQKLKDLTNRLIKVPLEFKLDKDWVLADYKFQEQTTFGHGSYLLEKLEMLTEDNPKNGSLLMAMNVPLQGGMSDGQLNVLTTAVENLHKSYPWLGVNYFKDTVTILNTLQKEKSFCSLKTTMDGMDKTSLSGLNKVSAYKEMESVMNLSHQKGMGLFFPFVEGKPCWRNGDVLQELVSGLTQPAPQKATYIQGLGENVPCWKKSDLGKMVGNEKNADMFIQVLEENGIVLKLPCDLRDKNCNDVVGYVMTKDIPEKSDTLIDRLWAPDATSSEWMVDKFYRIPTYTDHIFYEVVRRLTHLSPLSLLWKHGLVVQQGPVTLLVERLDEENGCSVMYVAGRMDKAQTAATPQEVAAKMEKEVLFCGYRSLTNIVEMVLQQRQCFYSRIFPCQTCQPSRNRYLATRVNVSWSKFDENLMKADHFMGRSCKYEGNKEGKNVERQDYLGPFDLPPMSHLPNHTGTEIVPSSCSRCYMCKNCCEKGMECSQNFDTLVQEDTHRGHCGCSTSQRVCSYCGTCNSCILELTKSYSKLHPSFVFGKDPAEGVNQYGSFIKGIGQAGQMTIKEKMTPEYFSHLEIILTVGTGLHLTISSLEDKLFELNCQTGSLQKGKEEISLPKVKGQPGDSWEILIHRNKGNTTGDTAIKIEMRYNSETVYSVTAPSIPVSVTIRQLSAICLVLRSSHQLVMEPSEENNDSKKVKCSRKLPSAIEMELTQSLLPQVENLVTHTMTGRMKPSQKSAIAMVLPDKIDRTQIMYPSFQSLRGPQLCHELCYFQALTEMPASCGWTKDEILHLTNAAGFTLPESFNDSKSEDSNTLYHLVLQWLAIMVHYPFIELPKYDKLFPLLAEEQLPKLQVERSLNQLLWMQALRMYIVSGAAQSGIEAGYPDKQKRKVLQDAIKANAASSDLVETVTYDDPDGLLSICSGHKASMSMEMQLSSVDLESLTNYSPFITQLILSMNFLTELPPLLFSSLPHLLNVELSDNYLEEIPSSIGTCRKLASLGLKSNNLTSLPEELASCKNLQRIDITKNMMDSIPLVVTKIPGLKRLYANNMMLTKLPDEIGNITELEKLYVNGNCLSKLPKSITKLKNLQDLSVSGVVWSKSGGKRTLMSKKHFEEFLHEQGISRWLDAHDKDRDQLFKAFDEDSNGTLDVKEMGNLDATLFNIFPRFGYKGIEAPEDDTPSGFPPEILELTNLRYLNLNYQGVVHIPSGIKHLRNLEVISVTNNPNLLSIAAEVGDIPVLKRLVMDECPLLKTPPKEIREKGFTTVYAYLKRLLTGSVECKRTKLMLVGLGGAGKTSLCRALVTDSLQQTLTGSEAITDGIDIASWTVKYDGEQIMYSVWDFAGQTVYYNTHQFFLSNRAVYLLLWNVRLGYEHSGLSFWLSSITVHAPLAPIFVIGSHIDQVSKVELPMQELKEAYPQIEDFLFISSYTGQGVDDLKKKLYKATLQQEYMGEQIPHAWLNFENNIIKTRTTGKIDILDYTVIEKKANESGIIDKTEIAQAIAFLHDLGALQHFNNQFLKAKVVINPQWIVDVMACVVSVKQSAIKEGRLHHDDIKTIWSSYPSSMYNWLLRLTEEFDLTFPLSDQNVNLVPCLMPDKRPEFDWPEPKKEEGITENKIVYKFDYLPAGLFNRGQVRLYQFSDSSIIWKKGSLLRKNGHMALVQQIKDQEMIVKVQGPRPENVLFLVHEVFEALIFESFHGLRYDYQLPCPDCLKQSIKDPHMFSASTVRRAIELKAPFLQCLKYFHTIMVTDLQAAMPPDTNNDYDVHLAKTVSGLREMRMNMAIDIFVSYCEKDAPKDRSKVIHPADVHEDLKKAGYSCWFPETTNKYSTDLLARALIDSSVFLVFMSDNYANDSQCYDIFQYAKLTLGKPIIVVAVGEDFSWKKSRVGIFLQDVVFVNMINAKKPVYAEKLKELLNQLDQISDTVMISRDTPECFISYCWGNSIQACQKGTKYKEEAIGYGDPREIKEYIEDAGKIKCWIDIERIGMTGLFEEIVKGLVNCRIVVACISDQYADSPSCTKEFLYAVQALKLPVVCAVVGKENQWMYTPVGMLAYNLPQVNLQEKTDDGLGKLLELVKQNMAPLKENPEKEKQKKEKQNNKQNEMSFQELYELAQRKFLRQIATYANAQDVDPYPRLFVIDTVKKETHSKKEDEKTDDGENEKDEANVEILDSGFKHRKYMVHTLCEYEYGWHKEGEAIMLSDDFGVTFLEAYAPYLSRMTSITRHSKELILNCFSEPEGQEYVKWLQETSLSVTFDLQDVYQNFRQYVISLDEERKMGGLKRCRLPSGKIIWLCDKHCKQMKVTILSDEVIVKESNKQGLVDHMVESLRKLDQSSLQIKFESSRKAKKTFEGEKKYEEEEKRELNQEKMKKLTERKISKRHSLLTKQMSQMSLNKEAIQQSKGEVTAVLEESVSEVKPKLDLIENETKNSGSNLVENKAADPDPVKSTNQNKNQNSSLALESNVTIATDNGVKSRVDDKENVKKDDVSTPSAAKEKGDNQRRLSVLSNVREQEPKPKKSKACSVM